MQFGSPGGSTETILPLSTGTHLYVLYESYGYSVASLYCLGFATGGLMSPITGPLVDRLGRKKSAILYCVLAIFINMLEQYPVLSGLIASRMIGGFTTNLLSSVFETWLDTEYRRRGLEKEKYELIMRDSVIVSNMSAIFSGYLAHTLAQQYGAVGPFEGAVTCTAVALVVVCFVWTENYGSTQADSDGENKGMMAYFKEAVSAYKEDDKMLRVGLLQGLSAGSVQIFVFLWAPTLRHFAQSAPQGVLGLDEYGEPAYGLIFGAFMGAGVLGGFVAPRLRRLFTLMLSPVVDEDAPVATIDVEGEGSVPIRPMAVEVLSAACYILSALMLFVPCLCSGNSPLSFSNSLAALLVYEFLIGVFLPCEGVIRSLYFPANARASVMTLPRIIVNVAVAIGVVSTNFVRWVVDCVWQVFEAAASFIFLTPKVFPIRSLKTAFSAVGCLMLISSALQLSLVSKREWSSLYSRVDQVQSKVARQARSLSFTVKDLLQSCPPPPERLSKRASLCSLTSSVSSTSDEDASDAPIMFDHHAASFIVMADGSAKVKAE